LALLAALAVAGDAGLSREKLLGLLWADAEEERARHSLTQALYAARRALRCDDLFIATAASVRLDFDRLACDVHAFELGVELGDLERAVALYDGPFLDGFFLSGAPEFDQWSSAQRERLQSMAARALETLATRSESAGDLGDAVGWRRRLASLAPLDSANVAKLMSALARSGDRAGALQQARLHATLLHQELELEPDPAVESLATQLRAAAPWEPGTTVEIAASSEEGGETSPPPTEPVDEATTQRADDRAFAAPYRADDPSVVTPVVGPSNPVPALRADHDVEHASSEWPRRTMSRPMAEVSLPIWLRWTILSIVIFTLLGVGVVIGRSRRDTGPVVERLSVPQRVVVAPFRVTGADPSLAYLRDGMVELLSTRLADDTAARSVDAGAVLGAWRAAGLTQEMDVPRDTVVKLASQLGAKRVVVGSVVGTPGRVMLRAALLVVPSGEVSAEASIAGAVDGLTGLIDRLAGQLLALEAGEDERLALQTTRSLPALRAFLAGQASLRALDYTAAMRQYDLALRRDTSFALAALQAATLADRLFDVAQLRRNLRTAWAHREALSARDRLLLSTYIGPRYPAPATVGEQRAAWQRILDAPTADADLWFTLGARILHDGELAALPSSRARSTEALQRALAAAPHAPARGLLAAMGGGALTMENGDGAAALGPFAPFAHWRSAVARSDATALRQLRDTMFRLGRANLRAIAMSSQYDGVALDDGAEALEQLGARESRTSERIDVLLAEHSQAMLRGRMGDALAAIDRFERAQPSSGAADRLRVLDGVYGEGDSTTAAVAARELTSLTGADPSTGMTSSGTWAANVCVLGQRSVARGDTARVRRAVESLRTHPVDEAPTLVVSAAPRACADLLDAAHAVLVRARDARTRLRQMDSLVLAPHVVGDLAQYAPLLIARLHERLDDHAGALAAVRRRPYMTDWPRYLAAMLREEARLAERIGDAAAAGAAHARLNAYRDSAISSAAEDARR